MGKAIQHYNFSSAYDKPVFDITPHHARMACCYQDKIGIYHLFVDFIDSSLNTLHSFQAIVKYYKSTDLQNWILVETAIDKGSYNCEKDKSDADCYGIGSPDVLCTEEYIYIFYSGRGSLDPKQSFNGLAHPGEPGYVSGDIMYARAKTDKNGAPCSSFKKMGIALNRENDWESMRVDDPCVVMEGNTIHLYYKGFRNNSNRDNIRLGYAFSQLKDMQFQRKPESILAVPGGLEMPRVFKHNRGWNMFLRHFSTTEGTIWRHYISRNGINWELKNPDLFNCAGQNPGKGAADMMLIKNFDGSFSGKALACGLEDGCLKLWLYHVINVSE